MFKRLSGSSNSLWRPKNPHSLEYLKYLHGVLAKHDKVTESNRKILVEALRAIAEILIWGDQNDSTVFDFFLERQMFTFFLHFMKQESGTLNVQLLQTLNILFENIRHETSLYFLLSNNHVNNIIMFNFDFENEEIMAYYISFVKTLSFKLNPCTIHFFFNEATNEFPLLTESLKLCNSKENMVRIAVRNIFLNIVRVDDPAMQTFVAASAKVYLLEVVDGLVSQALDLDLFVRSAENVVPNRESLRDKVDDVIDLLHYIGELLDVATVADSLSSLVSSRFLVPLLLNSLAPRRHNHSLLLSPVSSLFFFAEFLLVVAHHDTVQTFLSAFLFEDISVLDSHWIRNGEALILQGVDRPDRCSARVFFDALLGAFDASKNDDYVSFYGLMLIYAMFQNKGDVGELLSAAKLPAIEHAKRRRTTTETESPLKSAATTSDAKRARIRSTASVSEVPVEPNPVLSTDGSFDTACSSPMPPMEIDEIDDDDAPCDGRVMRAMMSVIEASSNEDSRLRPITLELACLVLRQILLVMDHDKMHTSIAEQVSRIRATLLQRLAGYVNSEALFLEWFEDEYAEFEVNHVKLDVIGFELLLPPAATAMSGLPLHKRLASGFEERIRTMILFYFQIRKLEKDLIGESETELPLKVGSEEPVAVGDCINLNNCDLLSCTVIVNKNEKQSRFLVTDRLQLILVEPDSRKAGWAIVRFVGLLQDTQITGDQSESRALHIVVEGQPTRLKKRQAVLTAKFVFDDHIRCMAAKQRLTKGRQTARGLKLQAICDLLGVPRTSMNASPRANPFRVVKGCAPGSVRKQMTGPRLLATPGLATPALDQSPSSNSIPDDPQPKGSPKKKGLVQDL